jgi:hypothetical protein
MSTLSRLGTLVIVAVYAIVMVCTNTHFTILDDESTIITVASRPILPMLQLFLSGSGQHEHPPFSDILLHLWLLATNYSFFSLRIFANIFFIAAILFIACSAAKLAGTKAYWTTLGIGLAWPFAFQYGRITGWYCVTMFLVSVLSWIYLNLLEGKGCGPWACFTFVSILLLWCNYFGAAILLLLLLDLILFHRVLAIKYIKPLVLSAAVIALSFAPLIEIVLRNVSQHTERIASPFEWKNAIAGIGYTVFSVFGSVAVAPWFLPMSIPIFGASIAISVSIWFSPGRHWFVYYILSMILLLLSGHMNIKRALFLLPWLFIAIGLSACAEKSSCPKLASGAIAVLVVTGWIGILSGNHYATTNLYEPWSRVAQVVAGDARRGATVISENMPFFFYLNYQLGLEADGQSAPGTYLGQSLYQSHGYKILLTDDWQQLAQSLRGKLVVVNGSGNTDQVQWTNALDVRLSQHCNVLGNYKAAPDPSLLLKKRFTKNIPTPTYRVDVTWFDCTSQGK